MKTSANARFSIKKWDEKPYSEGEDRPRLTRAVVIKAYTGDIEGEGRVEYLMMYRGDGSASFVGLERIDGRIAQHNAFAVRSSANDMRPNEMPIRPYTSRERAFGNWFLAFMFTLAAIAAVPTAWDVIRRDGFSFRSVIWVAAVLGFGLLIWRTVRTAVRHHSPPATPRT
jgi:hypothetical protein